MACFRSIVRHCAHLPGFRACWTLIGVQAWSRPSGTVQQGTERGSVWQWVPDLEEPPGTRSPTLLDSVLLPAHPSG